MGWGGVEWGGVGWSGVEWGRGGAGQGFRGQQKGTKERNPKWNYLFDFLCAPELERRKGEKERERKEGTKIKSTY